MAQPLQESVSAYCLMCAATNNRYNSELITKHWKFIYDECLKRGIQVISYGADGDSNSSKARSYPLGYSKNPQSPVKCH